MDINWKFPSKFKQTKKIYLRRFPLKDHPLQAVPVHERVIQKGNLEYLRKQNNSPSTKSLFVDPLSGVLDGSDPLSLSYQNQDKQNLLHINQKQEKNGINQDHSPLCEVKLRPWEEYRTEIFSKFHTKQQLTLASSFLSSTETGVVKVQSSIPDRTSGSIQTGIERVRSRLEQLDSLDDGITGSTVGGLREMGGLTQDQFTQHLMALKEEMKDSWNTDQRVKALKIAIQCVKALALSSPELFYPRKFMIITEILDTLGSLVNKRLNQLLKSSFPIHNLAKLEAEETARNWFYKVASIRELLPRLFLEAALMQCYSILDPKESKDVLRRLILMCRGIGDPIVGAYARMYIIKTKVNEPLEPSIIVMAIEDLLNCAKWGWNGQGMESIDVIKEDLESSRTVSERILTPPLNWLLQCFCNCASINQLTEMLLLGSNLTGVICYVFMMSILKTFPLPFLATNSSTICQYLQQCYNFGEYPHEIIIQLAVIVNKILPPDDSKVKLLNGAWHIVTQIQAIDYYLKAASAWVQYAAINFTWRELDKIIADILKRLSKFTTTDPHDFYPSLVNLITTAMCYCSHTEELCNLSSFQGLLSIFQREAMSSGNVGRGGVGFGQMKKLLDTALIHHFKEFTNPTVISLFLSLFSSLHDGINALTTQDEKRQIAQLVNAFIRQVNFGRDFEHQLEFYVDARAAFSSLDSVLEALVQQVCRLQVATMEAVKGRHTSKTGSFVRACTAYCFITIPSLSSALMRLKLYLLTGSIAMVNNCMGQGDSCIKSAVKEVLEISSELSLNTEQKNGYLTYCIDEVVLEISNVSSFLIAIPDPPDCSQPLYLYRGLSNAIKAFSFVDPILYCKLNLAVIKGVSCCVGDIPPYNLKEVDGNIALYGGDLVLKTEAENINSALLSQILVHLKKTSSAPELSQKHFLCDLLETIFIYCDLKDPKIFALSSSLILLTNRYKGNLMLHYETKLKSLTAS